MSIIGAPGLAMLLVLANIALCLTAESQRHGTLREPPMISTFAAIPLAGKERRESRETPALLSARRQ